MNWKEDALVHAKNQYPKESVGLLLNIKGKQRYYPCENLSITANYQFILNPEDYVKADKLGDIIAIVHSHPNTPPQASEADLVSCEDSNLPWYIVNPITEEWADWYRQNKNIHLVDYERSMTPEEFLKNPLFERYALDTGFVELPPYEQAKEGDVLLMSIMHPTLNHVAIFLGDMVLHHLADRLSCREPYSEWLQKCTAKRYRYAQNS